MTRYACTVKDLNVISSSIVSNISGEHIAEKSNYWVQGIVITNQTCAVFPKGFEVFFPNLYALTIKNSHLKTISASDISPFKVLNQLILPFNEITSLPGDLFVNKTYLFAIGFNGNPISEVGWNLLQPLRSLSVAQFSNLTCISEFANDTMAIGMLQNHLNEKCAFNATRLTTTSG